MGLKTRVRENQGVADAHAPGGASGVHTGPSLPILSDAARARAVGAPFDAPAHACLFSRTSG